ncbi:putative efflux pump antibiotic resistance protein [Xylariaceae sp. FL0804]|nr:putative efflux pump antibiotic resistance protein [Xylariaceae sp. FL0804]
MANDDSTAQGTPVYLQGFRFWTVTAVINPRVDSISTLLFLVNLETSVVTTALVSITNDLGNFDIVSWVLTSYLLGYVGFIVLSAKLSDIYGRKTAVIICIFLFTVLSGGCGAANTMLQVIILRAFQGLAGGGCFALSTILLIELVPPHKYAVFVAYTGIVIVMSSVLGPIVGGAISTNTTWRWIFLINVPLGSITLALAFVGIPSGFPLQAQRHSNSTRPMKAANISRLDIAGSALLLLATLSITAAFEQAGSSFAWDSALIITLLVVSVLLWVGLVLWERRVCLADTICEPILPWQFLTNRVIVGMLLGFFLLGGPITVAVFQLPQRYQLVNGLSALDAGVRMLPFAGGVTIGSSLGARIADQFKIPAIFIVLTGSIFQIVGLALLTSLPTSVAVPTEIYGYLILTGFGCGINYSLLYLMIPIMTQPRDRAVGMAMGNQFRFIGSAVGLALATTVFQRYLSVTFRQLGIDPASGLGLAGSLVELEPSSQEVLRQALGRAYNRQMLVLCIFSAAQVPCSLLMWKKEQILVS